MKGRCAAQGEGCPFAHGHKELRRPSAFEVPPTRQVRGHHTEDAGQILSSEALNSTSLNLISDGDVNFSHLMSLCTKDLETLLLNSAPEFYED